MIEARCLENSLDPDDPSSYQMPQLSIKRSAHRDIVNEALGQIKAGKAAHEIRLDTTVGTLRDRSIGWIVQVIHDVSDPATITQVASTITQAFEMCRVGPWNLSQASLTSPEALAGLRELRTTNPALHAALMQTTGTDPTPADSTADADDDDDPYQELDVYDDCDIPLDVVSGHLLSGRASVAANFASTTLLHG
ncbi:hypothetical protein B0H10DRAFT_2217522 [Mycena sp. CBHHK59/15]|nr:hypothetical protein B0H10DRAFT_2217522 [Mycena sp. CBHHK59/15]